jgi:hypothetical protein
MEPRSYRRYDERRVVTRLLIPYILVMGAAWWLIPSSAGIWRGIIPPVAWLPFVPVTWWYAKKRKELKARIAQTGGHMCLACDYDLRELDDNGVCPECGEMFSHSMCMDTWRFYYRDVFRDLERTASETSAAR